MHVIRIIAGNKSHAHHIDSFAYNESRPNSYLQFPPSLLGTPGTMADHLGKTNESLALLKQAQLKTKAILYHVDISGCYFFAFQLKILFYFLHEFKQRSSDVTGWH